MYFVLENDGQNKAPPKEVIPVDKDAPPVPEYNPVDDIPAASPAPPPVPAASPAPLPVGGDITTSSGLLLNCENQQFVYSNHIIETSTE